MAVEFSFGQVEAVCASINRIADDKRVAFMSRLKQLQKQGLTDLDTRPGRGKAGTYSFGDLMRFVIALELIQAGLMPQMAARIVAGSWSMLRHNIYVCSFAPEDTVGFSKKPTEYLWMISPEALRGLTRDGEGEWDHMERIQAASLSEAALLLAMSGPSISDAPYGESWRTLVLNGYGITQRVMRVVSFYFNYASRADLRADILAEIEAVDADMREFGEALQQLERSPEKIEEMRRRLAEMDEVDWSTNPPTPRHVLLERADEMIPFLSAQIKAFLTGPPQDQFVLDEANKPTLMELVDLNVLAVEMMTVEGEPLETVEEIQAKDPSQVKLGIAFTPFGRVLMKQLGGPWADALAAAAIAPPPDPLAEAADQAIAALTEEMREKIRTDASLFVEPFLSRLTSLGLVETGEADFPFDRWGKWTELGRAVVFALRFGRHARGIEMGIEAMRAIGKRMEEGKDE